MRIGLALGSGGPRGLAHIGVLKVLLRNGITPEIITGSSIGSLIGGAYSVFNSIDQVEELAYSSDMKTILSVLFDPTLNLGLLNGQKAMKFFREKIGDPRIESLSPKFYPVATNLLTGEAFVFERGSFAEAVRASISIPVIFKPVKIRGMLLVDGGLTQNVPAETAKERGADFVIGVNLNSRLSHSYYGFAKSPVGLYKIASESIDIFQYNLAKENCRHADFVIKPEVYNVGWDSFLKPKRVIAEGERAAERALPGLLKSMRKFKATSKIKKKL